MSEGRNIELISSLKSLKEDHWDDLARVRKRLIIATLLIADAFAGLLYQTSSLNLLDYILADNLPFEMVFLLQTVQAISCGFFYVKILFDDAKPGVLRSLGMFGSPLFLLAVVLITLEFLFTGQGLATDINIDSIAIVRETLTHSSTFLSIALGLTLTYKVQRYGNFAQSEFFMIGMFTTFVISWTGAYSPLFDSPRDDVMVWTLLIRVVVAAFIITGVAGVMVDLLVYRGFRLRDATPQVMMIGSLGVALALRAIFYLRFTSDKRQWFPDTDFSDQYTQKWVFPTTKLRIWLGDRSLNDSEDTNGNGVFDVETYTQQHADQGVVPLGSEIGDVIPGSGEDLDADGRFDANPQKYTHNNCEQSTDPETGELLFNEATGEPIYERIVSEGWSPGNPGSGGSRPAFELYDVGVDCVSQATNYYSFLKGSVAATIFTASILLYLFLTKSRLGMQMRAVADNPDLAASSGINVERVQTISAFLSAGISGIGGSVFAMTYLWNPVSAFTLLLPAFAIIVLGTIGSIPGAIVASIIVGFTKAVSAVILMGAGPDLYDRYSYFAFADVMPYTFLIAILLIMPQGIGHAWEEWKIERMRKKTTNDPEDSRTSRAVLAFLPTGIFGLHHWRAGRSDKAQNYSIVAISAYLFHRFSSFVGRESLTDDGCGRVCSESLVDMREELADLAMIIGPSTEEVGRMDELITSIDDYSMTNLEVLTGREDGTLVVEDSPYFSEAPSALDESWLDLMQTEIQTVNLIADAGEIIWPLIPLLLWALAIYEGARILREGKLSPTIERSRIRGITSPFSEISKLIQILRTYWERGRSLVRTADRRHSDTVRSVKDRMANQVAQAKDLFARESTLDRLSPWPSVPYGRRSKVGSNIAFLVLLLVLIGFLWWLPITDSDTWRWNKVFQVSNVVSLLCVFILMSFSLNLHTGYTGMVNFGVIFFVAIGGVTVAILTAPKSVNGYGWGFPSAIIASTVLAAAIGWGLAYPTARLRTDYFAIVTISLGEILRQLLAVEPLLRTGTTAQGIYSYPKPLYEWWFCGSTRSGPGEEYFSPINCRDAMLDSPSMAISNLLDLGAPASYFTLLSIIGIIAVIAVWILLESLISSPWGRVLKAIREDEEVAQHHGHNVLTHKAASLALGAVIASFAGSLWIWKLSGIESAWMAPATSTFLVWAAFVVGGTGNNRGMVIGSFIMVLMHFVFNVLIAASSPDLPLYTTANRIDSLFAWIVTEQWEVTRIFLLIFLIGILIRSRATIEIGACGSIIFAFTALVLGGRSILVATNIHDEVSIAGAGMSYVKLLLIGLLMIFSMKFNPRGLLPEVPNRPDRPAGGDSL